jgi:hypothetical protein
VRRRTIAMMGGAILAISLAAAPSWSDTESEVEADTASISTDEPITGTAVSPSPGTEAEPARRFQPYSIGPPEAAWPYASLSADEKAQVDRARAQPRSDATNNAFATGARERSVTAKAEAAATQLGIDGVEIGVVP